MCLVSFEACSVGCTCKYTLSSLSSLFSNSIVPDLKDVVYQVGVAYGSQADWEFVWQQYQSSTDPYEKRLYLRALAQSTEPWILNRYV